jgi:hypothetical protein
MPEISVTEWRMQSQLGMVCALLGCNANPNVRCDIEPSCGIHYCQEHYHVHFHVVDDTLGWF